MTPKFRLVAVDLDGTTLNKQGALTARTKKALESVAATGAAVALCSGRSSATIAPTRNQLSFASVMVSFNGCVAVDSSQKGLFRETLSKETVASVLAIAQRLGHTVNFYKDDDVYVATATTEHKDLVERYRIQTGANFLFVESYSNSRLADYLPCKLLVLCNNPLDVERILAQELGDSVKIVRDDYFVECLPAATNKGTGFQKLCGSLNIPMESTVAFGDGLNDIEFLQAAGVGIAMANAKPELKAVADRVTVHTNQEDGMAIEIEGMLQQGLFGGI